MTTREKVDELTRIMADEAERLIPLNPHMDPDDVIRGTVEAYGFSFNAWFCVAWEIGDRANSRRLQEAK